MSENAISLIVDLPKIALGENVTIAGAVHNRKQLTKTKEGIWLKDITGSMLAILDIENDLFAKNWKSDEVPIGSKIRLRGKVDLNSKGYLIISKISDITILDAPKTSLSEMPDEIRDAYSKILMSRICRDSAAFFQAKNFTEFESRLISNNWSEEGLEPLLVNYPGFGAPVVLTTSPSAQVTEFLTVTLRPRAFTLSTSFTTSYRFPQGSAETKVIVAKATDLDLNTHIQYFSDLAKKVLSQFGKIVELGEPTSLDWPDKEEHFKLKSKNDIELLKYSAYLPVVGKNWYTHIDTIFHLLDKDGNLLAEGAREIVNEGVTISSMILYPSQFLHIIEKAPKRQLQNLLRLYDGHK